MVVKQILLSTYADTQISDIKKDNYNDMTFYNGWYHDLNKGIEDLNSDIRQNDFSKCTVISEKEIAYSIDCGYIIFSLLNTSIIIRGFKFLLLPNRRIGNYETFECDLFWEKQQGVDLRCGAYDHYNSVPIWFTLKNKSPYGIHKGQTKFLIIKGKIVAIDSEHRVTLDDTEILLENVQQKKRILLSERNFQNLIFECVKKVFNERYRELVC